MPGRTRVVFFQRKPLPIHKSVEFIFEDVRNRMPQSIEPVKYVFSQFSKGIAERIKIIGEAKKHQGDVNHVTGDIHFAAIGLPKKNTLLTVLDCGMLSDSKGVKHALLKYFWFTLPLKHCQYITVISEATKQEVLKYTNFPEENIYVVPVAISESYSHQPKVFNSNKPCILQVGTVFNKNIPRLIEAIKDIPCTIRFIGRLSDEDLLLLEKYKIEYTAEQGLTHEQLVEAYAECDLLSFVSTYEGFGMPILEAQATGRPVITSNLLSMPEVAGDAACLVNPFDVQSIQAGILKVINDNQYREELIRKGLENVKRFEPQYIANQYLALYQKIAAN